MSRDVFARFPLVVAATIFCLRATPSAADVSYQDLPRDAPLVTVDDATVTKGDLEFELLWRGVDAQKAPDVRRRVLEQLVERRLIRRFLEQRRVTVPEELLDARIEQVRRLVEAAGEEFDDVIERLGFTEASLRSHLALPLAWRIHLGRVVTAGRLQEFFAERRMQFDGTRVRASQIVVAVPDDADEAEWSAAEEQLRRLRDRIQDGSLEFGEAARRHSTSPSARLGGDLGEFSYHGTVPEPIAEVAFGLQPGEISQPFRTEFGVHLLRVTERTDGQLSLEDVRESVLDRLSREMWAEEVERQREAADLVWHVDPAVLSAP